MCKSYSIRSIWLSDRVRYRAVVHLFGPRWFDWIRRAMCGRRRRSIDFRQNAEFSCGVHGTCVRASSRGVVRGIGSKWPAAERSVPDRIVVSPHAASPARRPGDESWLAGLDEADRRSAPKTRRTVSHHILVHLGGVPVAGDRHGRRKCPQPEFSEAPRLGRQARGKRACRTIALRHVEQKGGDVATT